MDGLTALLDPHRSRPKPQSPPWAIIQHSRPYNLRTKPGLITFLQYNPITWTNKTHQRWIESAF